MPELEIIGAPQSFYVRAARMACVEKGVAYTLCVVRPHTPEVDAIHPLGKIPVMRHGDVRLFESKAIATYVDRAFPGPALFPEDPIAGAEVEQWVSIANATLFPAFGAYFGAYFFPGTPDGTPDRSRIEAALPKVREYIALYDRAMAATGYLVGEGITYADIGLLPVLGWLAACPESADALAATAHLAGYLTRHSQRASFQSTIPPSFANLPPAG